MRNNSIHLIRIYAIPVFCTAFFTLSAGNSVRSEKEDISGEKVFLSERNFSGDERDSKGDQKFRVHQPDSGSDSGSGSGSDSGSDSGSGSESDSDSGSGSEPESGSGSGSGPDSDSGSEDSKEKSELPAAKASTELLPSPDRKINAPVRLIGKESPEKIKRASKKSQPSRHSNVRMGRTRVEACEEKAVPAGTYRFQSGESLYYDLDIMGVRAGTLNLTVNSAEGSAPSFTATTSTNSFFASIRSMEGTATSYSRDRSLYPARYREDSTEDGVRKWAEVIFHSRNNEVDVRFGIGQRERRLRHPVTDTPFDLISLSYYLRTVNLEIGDSFCFDVYANRLMWRVAGTVEEEEFIRTPAGGFETWRFSGTATRMDNPNIEREIHTWIAQNEQRTPVAAMSTIDLGPVRARISRIEGPGGTQRQSTPGGGRW